MKRILPLLIVLCHCLCTYSQERRLISLKQSEDSMAINQLIFDFYKEKSHLSRTFNYEVTNKKKKLYNRSVQIEQMGFGAYLGTTFLGNILVPTNNWLGIAVVIPISSISTGELFLFQYLSKRIKSKADEVDLMSDPDSATAKTNHSDTITCYEMKLSDKDSVESCIKIEF